MLGLSLSLGTLAFMALYFVLFFADIIDFDFILYFGFLIFGLVLGAFGYLCFSGGLII